MSDDALVPAQHADPDGPVKGWSAADVHPSEYSSDDYARQFPTLALHESDEEPRGLMAAASVNITRDNLRTIASRTGRKVVEAWSSHDQGQMGTVVGVVMHHTGSAWGTAVAPTLAIVRDGRSDLVNALSAFYLDRAGTIYLITEKVAWHAGTGLYRGISDGNGHFLGIESESDGVHWTQDTIDAYVALVAEIVRFLGVDPAVWTVRHAVWATPPGRKNDFSGLDEANFRARIAARLNGTPAPEVDVPLTNDDVTKVAQAVWTYVRDGAGPAWVVDRLVGIDAKTGSLGPISTAVQDVQSRVGALETKVGQVSAPSLDEAKLAAALLSDPASVDRLGAAIAAHLKLASS